MKFHLSPSLPPLPMQRSHQGTNGNKVNNSRPTASRVNQLTSSAASPRREECEMQEAVAASSSSSRALVPPTAIAPSAVGEKRTFSKIETISSRVTPRMVVSNDSSVDTSVINSPEQAQYCKSACGASSYASYVSSSDTHTHQRTQAGTSGDSGAVERRGIDTATVTCRAAVGSGGTGVAGLSVDNEISKKQREERRKAIKREFNKNWQNNSTTLDKSGCNMSFVFNPWGKLMNYWSMIVCCSFIYNSWVILYRFAFDEINDTNAPMWLLLDGIADLIYLCDIIINFRIGYFDEGVLQTDPSKIRQHYINSTKFYIDCLCLLPLDFLYLSIGFNSIFRTFRLIKIYRFWSFLDRTERHTNYPNVFRTLSLLHYILIMFHWNACLYQLISKRFQFSSHDWFGGSRIEDCSDVVCDYLHAFYWSTLALTLIGDLPR